MNDKINYKEQLCRILVSDGANGRFGLWSEQSDWTLEYKFQTEMV